MAIPRFAALFLALSAVSFPAQTQHREFQVWPSLTLETKAGRLNLTGDAILQLSEDQPHLAQFLLRGIADYRVTTRFSVGGGYTYVGSKDEAGSRHEHRILQELVYHTPIQNRHIGFTLRTRLEERFRERETGVGLRLREMVRIDLPLTESGMTAIAWNETFLGLNRTVWSGRSGPALMLNFVGLGIPVSRTMTVEPGYLNFTSFDPGRNRVRHILYAKLIARL